MLIKKIPYKSKLILISLLLFYKSNYSQLINNLVNNGSVEDYTVCPNNTGALNSCKYWFHGTITSSVEYFNPCTTNTTIGIPTNALGKRFAQDGNSYLGFGLYVKSIEGREYAETSLKNKLKNNKQYCVTFYVSLAEYSRYAIANISVYFSADSLKNYYPIVPPNNYFFTPNVESNTLIPIADTINWVKIQGTYLAQGNEQFITISNFRNDANTNIVQTKPLLSNMAANISYYYLDNISVVEINPAKAAQQKTVTLCANTTYTLGTDSTWDATYSWFPNAGLSCTNCPNPVVTATSTIKYYLTKQQCSATTNDSVLIQIYTPSLTANAGLNKVLCPNQQTKLGVNDSTQFSIYNWLPNLFLNCTNCATPISNPNTTTTYTLNKTECAINSTGTVQVILKDTCNLKEAELILPQLISANGDGINDEIIIQLPNTKSASFQVFNRWGNEVYKSEGVSTSLNVTTIKWDGTYNTKPLPSGTYFYTVESINDKDEQKNYRQFVVLIR